VKGIEPNLLKDHPNCQLISDNCECFVIDKHAFLNFSPPIFSDILQYQVFKSLLINLLININSLLKKYTSGLPTKDEIDNKFKEYVKWKLYRKKIFQETFIQRFKGKIGSYR